MISVKKYRCTHCNKDFQTSTNHYGEIYSAPCCGMVVAECLETPDGSPPAHRPIKRGVRELKRMKTKSKESPSLSKKYGAGARMIVNYGFHYLQGNRRPYFSITADISTNRSRQRNYIEAGGCLHDEIRKYFPELRHLLQWHGVADDAEPMHYVANAIYWLEKHHEISQWPAQSYDPNPLEAFKSTVVFGALPDDNLDSLLAPLMQGAKPELLTPEVAQIGKRSELAGRVKQWCAARLPALQQKMRDEMIGDNIPFIAESEYLEAQS